MNICSAMSLHLETFPSSSLSQGPAFVQLICSTLTGVLSCSQMSPGWM